MCVGGGRKQMLGQEGVTYLCSISFSASALHLEGFETLYKVYPMR